ncbi:MAG: hypothetical protein BWY72_01487 [Bacteroidetes bacterium ADurb.Bin416]|nr:MAG: hypothetical protein BWY72_01487 [Bacteroidetes bacterium ADurb.Bin416]
MHHPEDDPNYKGLSVQKGIEQPPIVNPYRKAKVKREMAFLHRFLSFFLSFGFTKRQRPSARMMQRVMKAVVTKRIPWIRG